MNSARKSLAYLLHVGNVFGTRVTDTPHLRYLQIGTKTLQINVFLASYTVCGSFDCNLLSAPPSPTHLSLPLKYMC